MALSLLLKRLSHRLTSPAERADDIVDEDLNVQVSEESEVSSPAPSPPSPGTLTKLHVDAHTAAAAACALYDKNRNEIAVREGAKQADRADTFAERYVPKFPEINYEEEEK